MPSYIPPELVAEILGHVASTGSRVDLEQASLCCRLWRQLCLPHLYGNVVLAAIADEDFSEELPEPYKRHRLWTKSCQFILNTMKGDGVQHEEDARIQALNRLDTSLRDLPNVDSLEIFAAGYASGVRATISSILSSRKISTFSLHGTPCPAQSPISNEPLIMPYVTHLSLSRDPLQLFHSFSARDIPLMYSPQLTSLALSHCPLDGATLIAITPRTALRALSIESCNQVSLSGFMEASSRHAGTLELLFYGGIGDNLEGTKVVDFPVLKYLALRVKGNASQLKGPEKLLETAKILAKIQAPRLKIFSGPRSLLETGGVSRKLGDRTFYPSLRKIIWVSGDSSMEAEQAGMEEVQIVRMTEREVHRYFSELV